MICGCCSGPARKAFTAFDLSGESPGTEPFHYARCERCGTFELANVPSDLSAYYGPGYYDQMDQSLTAAQAELSRGQLATFAPFVSKGRVIDIGPGMGAFLKQASGAFASRAAVERDQRCATLLRADGVEVVETDQPVAGIANLAPADAVTMFHVIEHVPNPMELVDAAAAKLLPGGVLTIATPNPQSLSFRVCGRWWRHVDAPRHLYLLPLDVIKARAERHGLRLLTVTTTDPVGLLCNSVTCGPWARRVTRRLGGRAAYILREGTQRTLGAVERRGMLGSAYTAVFRR